MKKIFLTCLVALISLSTYAQEKGKLVGSDTRLITTTTTTTVVERTPVTYIDLGIGGFADDAEGFAIDFGLRFTKMFTPNIGWDILKISAQTTPDSEIYPNLNLQAKTGIRGVTPILFGKSGAVYGYFDGGYGYNIHDEGGGFAWEAGIGVNLSKQLSLGLAYNNCSYTIERYYYDEDVSCGYVSLRLGIGL